MPNPTHIFADNAPGPWYVNTECICCGLCENVAPETFRMAADYDHHLVYRQPVTPEELADAEDARERCPVEAIGKDRLMEDVSTAAVSGQAATRPGLTAKSS